MASILVHDHAHAEPPQAAAGCAPRVLSPFGASCGQRPVRQHRPYATPERSRSALPASTRKGSGSRRRPLACPTLGWATVPSLRPRTRGERGEQEHARALPAPRSDDDPFAEVDELAPTSAREGQADALTSRAATRTLTGMSIDVDRWLKRHRRRVTAEPPSDDEPKPLPLVSQGGRGEPPQYRRVLSGDDWLRQLNRAGGARGLSERGRTMTTMPQRPRHRVSAKPSPVGIGAQLGVYEDVFLCSPTYYIVEPVQDFARAQND